MDLFLANVITIIFFVSAYLLVKRNHLITLRSSYFTAVSIVTGLILGLLLLSVCFALVIGITLPEIYVQTFAYKAVFAWLILVINWLWQMVNQQAGRKYV